MSLRLFKILIAMLSLSSAACSVDIQEQPSSSPTAIIVTSTLAPSLTPRPSETPRSIPPASQPTPPAVEGMTATQINVRAEPSTASDVLGIIPENTKVEIIGKDPGGNWWQILYPPGVDGTGWVTAQYIRTAIEPEVPTIGGDGLDPNHGNVAVIQQKINIRSGPGTGFNSVGTLNPQDVVKLTGKDSHGTWLQIEFPAGHEGRGWISAAFVQAQGVEELPIITEAGQVVGTGTPTSIPPPPTPTLVPAWMDNDAPDNPLAYVIFNPSGTHQLIYNGAVSAPEGDTQDWIGFKPYGTLVLVSLECAGSNSLKADIMENNLPTDLAIECGQKMKALRVKPNAAYLLHLQAIQSSENLLYINYTLTIKTGP